MSRQAVLDQLRAYVARVAPARVLPGRLPTGIDALDARTGGWPRPGVAVVAGPVGTGRLAAILPALAAVTRQGLAAVVDTLGWLYPPGLPGVILDRLLLVRPGAARTGWTSVQLARSRDLDLLVLLDPPRLGRFGRRLLHAAEEGTTAVVVLATTPDPDLPATLRLDLAPPGRVRIRRGGRGPPGATVTLSPEAGPPSPR